VGDWTAVWDQELRYWYFYNTKTEKSTWEQPPDLAHLTFSNEPQGSGAQPKSYSYHPAPISTLHGQYAQSKQILAGTSGFTSNTDFVDSSNCLTFQCRQANIANVVVPDGGFFGFNTSVFASRGLAGGIYANLAGIYDNIVQAYVEDVYTDVIEGYTIATIKLVGWFFFGSYLIVKGAVLNALNDGRSFSNNHLVENVVGDTKSNATLYKLPWIQGLDLTFPVEKSITSCYKDRETCVKNDFPSEFHLLLENFANMKEFVWNWLELGEKIGHMVEEGETEL
jgi:hypothetical protein